MVKVTVLYGPPADPAAFDAYYFSTHVPLVDKIPGLDHVEVSKFLPGPDGTPATYYLQAELYYADADALAKASATPESQAANADVANFLTGSIELLIAEVVRER